VFVLCLKDARCVLYVRVACTATEATGSAAVPHHQCSEQHRHTGLMLPHLNSLGWWHCPCVCVCVSLSLSLSLSTRRNSDDFPASSLSQVVVGWPAFLIYYLRKIQQAGRLDNARVQDRVGFLFQQYRPEYLFFDVVETVRKLWLVTVVRVDPPFVLSCLDGQTRLLAYAWMVVLRACC
jgi:hypothetical protein